ncbi:MAG: tetratricopeptide repeat protein [Planctomycetes bacterium]|nr:tetratricopeptide repeat protein [Planctomycetota bacterium]
MSAANTRSPLIVEDVVTALTGDVASGPSARTALKDRMRRATTEFDERTAEAFARALLDSLTQNPTDPRQLEALVILGLAHPHVLERHRISLDKEAERLAFLLERAGEVERAESLQDMLADRLTVEEVATGEAPTKQRADHDQLVERYLRQADEAALAGRTREAIACLQEIHALQPGRRDVTRMIRELRARRKVRRWKLLRGLRWVGVLGLVALAAWGVWQRELHVREEFAALPPARGEDVAALRARLVAIDELVQGQIAWFGMGDALREKQAIEERLRRLADRVDAVKHDENMQTQERLQEADAARVRGLMYAQQGKFDEALKDLRLALQLAPANWEHARRVKADLEAIEAFKARPKSTGEGAR